MTDFYAAYAAWHLRHYGEPFAVSREAWLRDYCHRPRPRVLTDDEFDDAKERDGDAQ